MKRYKRIVLAYSGGLDTSVMLRWLKDHYFCDVVACCVNVGQREKYGTLKKRALATGASQCFIIDARKEFVTQYCWPALKPNATYENDYLLGTALARPIIAEKVVEVARRVGADVVSHGATGKGNDQVRFELTFKALAPHLKIVAPWREWTIRGREEAILYARKHNIPVGVTKSKPYSTDANLWHISYEGGLLEDPANAPKEDMFELTVSPERAPAKGEKVDIGFKKGIPSSVNGRPMDPVSLVERLNRVAGRNGIGRVDLIENRLVGIKSRGVYESPAATLLYRAHRELESLTLDRGVLHDKNLIAQKYGKLVYDGLWHSPLKTALDRYINESQKFVTGHVKFKLYKGNIITLSRSTPHSLYWETLATFEEDDIYNQKDAEGFINLHGLPLKVAALLRRRGRH